MNHWQKRRHKKEENKSVRTNVAYDIIKLEQKELGGYSASPQVQRSGFYIHEWCYWPVGGEVTKSRS